MNSDLTLYHCIDEADLRLPPPTTLYNLEPIGIGTGMVESLTSYVGRLADAHTTSVSMLMKYELSKHFNHSYLGPDQPTSRSYFAVSAMNGRCNSAADWVNILESLTLRRDLKFLTFLPYREMLGDKTLLKRNRHWCPECFHEWQKQGRICYEPLIWKAAPVKICPIHLCRLRVHCPHCGSVGFDLEPQHTPGYCHKCLKWLGDGTEFRMGEEDNVDRYQDYALKVAELLAVAPKLDHAPNSDNITALFQFLVTRRAKGCRALGRLLGFSHGYIVDWLHGEYPPNFEALVRTLVMFRIDPADVVSQHPRFAPTEPAAGVMTCNQEMGSVKHQNKIDWVEVEALMTAMAEGRVSALPIAELAERIGCSAASIYKKYPDLSGSVASKYYAQKQKKRRQYLSDIHEQVTALVSANAQITKKEIYKAIGGKGTAKRNVVRNVFQNVDT